MSNIDYISAPGVLHRHLCQPDGKVPAAAPGKDISSESENVSAYLHFQISDDNDECPSLIESKVDSEGEDEGDTVAERCHLLSIWTRNFPLPPHKHVRLGSTTSRERAGHVGEQVIRMKVVRVQADRKIGCKLE